MKKRLPFLFGSIALLGLSACSDSYVQPDAPIKATIEPCGIIKSKFNKIFFLLKLFTKFVTWIAATMFNPSIKVVMNDGGIVVNAYDSQMTVMWQRDDRIVFSKSRGNFWGWYEAVIRQMPATGVTEAGIHELEDKVLCAAVLLRVALKIL